MGLFKADKHFFHSKTINTPYEKSVVIHEHKAPTDESVKLLNELTNKAKENIIYSTKIESNYLKALAMYYYDDMVNNRMIFKVKFELNGNSELIEGFIDNFVWRKELSKLYIGFGSQEIFELVHKKLSEMIASHLINNNTDIVHSITDRMSR